MDWNAIGAIAESIGTYNSGQITGITAADVKSVLSTPGGMSYWKGAKINKLHGTGGFVDFVDSILGNISDRA